MKTIRWGMIGCGDVTEIKSGPAFQKAENSELVAVMRRDGVKAEDYAKRHKVPKWYDNAEALIEDAEVDAVYIATPPDSHMDYTLKAAAAGKPVYVEKPMALNHTECQKMIAACEKAGVPLFVAYYRRALPRFLKVKELIDGGVIGAVRSVATSLCQPPEQDLKHPWHVNPAIAGGGKFMDVGCHLLDLLDFFFGPVAEVRGHAANQAKLYEAEDIVCGQFSFASGVEAVGTWCFTAGEPLDRTEIIGSKGRISFSTFDLTPVLLQSASGSARYPIVDPPHVQQPLIETIIAALNGNGSCPSTGASAARTSRVMDEFLKEFRS
jgi:predicted dehydrogenase